MPKHLVQSVIALFLSGTAACAAPPGEDGPASSAFHLSSRATSNRSGDQLAVAQSRSRWPGQHVLGTPVAEPDPEPGCERTLHLSGLLQPSANKLGLNYNLFGEYNGQPAVMNMHFRTNQTGELDLGSEVNADIVSCEQCISLLLEGNLYVTEAGLLRVAGVTPPLDGMLRVDLAGVRLRSLTAPPSVGGLSTGPDSSADLCLTDVTLKTLEQPDPEHAVDLCWLPPCSAPQYEQDVRPILHANCGGDNCHSTGGVLPTLINAPLSSLLEESPGAQQPYVTPNNLAESYLWRRISDPESGAPLMPLAAAPLSDAELNTIRRWIKDGDFPEEP